MHCWVPAGREPKLRIKGINIREQVWMKGFDWICKDYASTETMRWKYTVNVCIVDLKKGKKKYLWLDKWE